MENLIEKIEKDWLKFVVNKFYKEVKNENDVEEICDLIDELHTEKEMVMFQVGFFCEVKLTAEMEEYATDEEISHAFGNWSLDEGNLTFEKLEDICKARAKKAKNNKLKK